eukprot:Cvel_30373.t1-p1 / transcript=Cvel_30373.t1 / gene=Cvel_30373 / organism=Chromera_velia_CCMP2878 / gene_product=hypothetical protein / transcript_product=hypothetical protein / location=Cvel_scaffold4319:9425-10784(+) / protein_length=453 / sequence_SO=supercontig / SO=protein_coding / is_pseudo=false
MQADVPDSHTMLDGEEKTLAFEDSAVLSFRCRRQDCGATRALSLDSVAPSVRQLLRSLEKRGLLDCRCCVGIECFTSGGDADVLHELDILPLLSFLETARRIEGTEGVSGLSSELFQVDAKEVDGENLSDSELSDWIAELSEEDFGGFETNEVLEKKKGIENISKQEKYLLWLTSSVFSYDYCVGIASRQTVLSLDWTPREVLDAGVEEEEDEVSFPLRPTPARRELLVGTAAVGRECFLEGFGVPVQGFGVRDDNAFVRPARQASSGKRVCSLFKSSAKGWLLRLRANPALGSHSDVGLVCATTGGRGGLSLWGRAWAGNTPVVDIPVNLLGHQEESEVLGLTWHPSGSFMGSCDRSGIVCVWPTSDSDAERVGSSGGGMDPWLKLRMRDVGEVYDLAWTPNCSASEPSLTRSGLVVCGGGAGLYRVHAETGKVMKLPLPFLEGGGGVATVE